MKKILKVLGVLCLVLIMSVQQVFVKADIVIGIVEDEPKITFVGVGHSPLVEGDTENFIITTKCLFLPTKVQYRIFLHDDTRKTKLELTEGYTELVDHKIPYEINPSYVFKKGKYRLEIWVRADKSTNEYDSTYTANLNCVNRDNSNRVYANGEMLLQKDTYRVGEKVVISGIKDIGGITGPYKYRLHIFSPNKIGNPGFGFDNTGWAKNVTRYADTIEWTPQEPGTYVLDAHVITPNSTLWKNVQANKDIIYGGYEAWKLKTITVVPKVDDFFSRTDIATISNYNQYTVDNNVIILKDSDDFETTIKASYTTDTDYNPSLKTNFYNIVNTITKPEMYTELVYSDGSRGITYVSKASIIYKKTKVHKDINDFAFLYSFYTDNYRYIDTQKSPLVYLGYKPLGEIGVGDIFLDENSISSFYKSNKILFGEHGDSISESIINNYKLNRNVNGTSKREFWGDFMIDQSSMNGDIQINFFIKG